MATHSESDLRFEIGHVLFIDIVGYSNLLIDEQRERIRELKGIVRGTAQFRLAEAEGKLLRLPTGDGGALVFRNTQEAPVLCALEISKALKNNKRLKLRRSPSRVSPFPLRRLRSLRFFRRYRFKDSFALCDEFPPSFFGYHDPRLNCGVHLHVCVTCPPVISRKGEP
jgi:hypothetical protein